MPSISVCGSYAAGYRAAFTVAADAGWDGDRFRIPRSEPPAEAAHIRASPIGISVVVPAHDRLPVGVQSLDELVNGFEFFRGKFGQGVRAR